MLDKVGSELDRSYVSEIVKLQTWWVNSGQRCSSSDVEVLALLQATSVIKQTTQSEKAESDIWNIGDFKHRADPNTFYGLD